MKCWRDLRLQRAEQFFCRNDSREVAIRNDAIGKTPRIHENGDDAHAATNFQPIDLLLNLGDDLLANRLASLIVLAKDNRNYTSAVFSTVFSASASSAAA